MEKFETCKHSTGNFGQTVVYVKPSCPRMNLLMGNMVSAKNRCRKCVSWEPKEEK